MDYCVTIGTWAGILFFIISIICIFKVIERIELYPGRVLVGFLKDSLRLITITLTLSLIAVSYAFSEPRNDNVYESKLVESIKSVDSMSYKIIDEGDFSKLSDLIIDNSYEKDGVIYRIIPNNDLKYYIQLSKQDKYKTYSYSTDYNSAALPMSSEYEKGGIIYWPFSVTEKKANGEQLHIDIDLRSKDPSCFVFSAEGTTKNDKRVRLEAVKPFWSPINNDYFGKEVCLEKNIQDLDKSSGYNYSYRITSTFSTKNSENLRDLMFQVTPKNSKDTFPIEGEAIFRYSEAHIFTKIADLNFCIEGRPRAEEERVFSYNDGEIRNYACER